MANQSDLYLNLLNAADIQGSLDPAINASNIGLFNVKSYGAVGNGATDDTVAIQAAIAAAQSAGGGNIWFPTATYVVSAGFTMTHGSIAIIGNGSTFKVNSTSTFNLFSSGASTSGVNFFTFRDFYIDFNETPGSGSYAFYFPYSSSCSWQHIEIDGACQNVFYFGNQTTSITNNRIDHVYTQNLLGSWLTVGGTVNDLFASNIYAGATNTGTFVSMVDGVSNILKLQNSFFENIDTENVAAGFNVNLTQSGSIFDNNAIDRYLADIVSTGPAVSLIENGAGVGAITHVFIQTPWFYANAANLDLILLSAATAGGIQDVQSLGGFVQSNAGSGTSAVISIGNNVQNTTITTQISGGSGSAGNVDGVVIAGQGVNLSGVAIGEYHGIPRYPINTISTATNVVIDGCSIPCKQNIYALSVSAGASDLLVTNNQMLGYISVPVLGTWPSSSLVANNQGYNPVGKLTVQPTVPVSGSAYTNAFGLNSDVYLATGSGISIPSLLIGGNATGLSLGQSGTLAVRVGAGQSITVNYGGSSGGISAPTWEWFGE